MESHLCQQNLRQTTEIAFTFGPAPSAPTTFELLSFFFVRIKHVGQEAGDRLRVAESEKLLRLFLIEQRTVGGQGDNPPARSRIVLTAALCLPAATDNEQGCDIADVYVIVQASRQTEQALHYL